MLVSLVDNGSVVEGGRSFGGMSSARLMLLAPLILFFPSGLLVLLIFHEEDSPLSAVGGDDFDDDFHRVCCTIVLGAIIIGVRFKDVDIFDANAVDAAVDNAAWRRASVAIEFTLIIKGGVEDIMVCFLFSFVKLCAWLMNC